MTKVVATGVFAIIHPGHILYLKEARKLGDELIVIVARDCMVEKRKKPIVPENQRLSVVKALRVVDKAILGDMRDIFNPIKKINPDIIALGVNQHFNIRDLETQLRERGLEAKVVRVHRHWDSELNSSKKIVRRIRE